jgi:hypothetical protein
MKGDRRSGVTFGVAVVVCSLVVLSALPVVGGAVMRPQSTAPSATVWLCRPGLAPDPCTTSPASTSVSAAGAPTVVSGAAAHNSKFDCFYAYPTVSTEPADNANLEVQPAEIGAAVSQASRFSQVCRVWAPMYRQRTAGSLVKGLGGDPTADDVAYDSLLTGWKEYLAHDNHGRPIIFIGHSQGAAMLIRLLRSQVDPNPVLRRRMVSAVILGGNVQVPIGKTVGGSFRHIPLCGSARATGCVIAYSTFGHVPPLTSDFGRPGQGVSLQSGQRAAADQQVACVNPVTFSNAAGSLLPFFLSATTPVRGVTVGTPWVSFPGLYTARCQHRGGATWLQVTPTSLPSDPRPTVTASLGPDWGYHVDDVNLALGNLVADVRQEEASYRG